MNLRRDLQAIALVALATAIIVGIPLFVVMMLWLPT